MMKVLEHAKRTKDLDPEIEEWHEAYEEEIELFEECELEVLIDELIGEEGYFTEEQVMRCVAFIAAHGTNDQWHNHLKGRRFEFRGCLIHVSYIRGRTPMEVAWRLYRVTDESEPHKTTVKKIREAMMMLDAKDVDGHWFTPFDEDDPDRNWTEKFLPRHADPLTTEARIKTLRDDAELRAAEAEEDEIPF